MMNVAHSFYGCVNAHLFQMNKRSFVPNDLLKILLNIYHMENTYNEFYRTVIHS
jgi:hypothetical protein